MADMVIPDLARWEDWTVVEKLVELFKNAPDESNWVRAPVISYLRMCPKPEAKKYIEELRKVDPDAVARAETFLDWEMSDDEDDDWDDETESDDADAEPSNDSTEKTPADSKPASSEGDKGADDDKAGDPSGIDKRESASIQRNRVLRVEVPSLPSDNSETESVESLEENNLDGQYVSTSIPVSETASQPVQPEIPQTENTEVVGAATPSLSSLPIVFVPVAICMVLFVLLWSVISGAFERLLF